MPCLDIRRGPFGLIVYSVGDEHTLGSGRKGEV